MIHLYVYIHVHIYIYVYIYTYMDTMHIYIYISYTYPILSEALVIFHVGFTSPDSRGQWLSASETEASPLPVARDPSHPKSGPTN